MAFPVIKESSDFCNDVETMFEKLEAKYGKRGSGTVQLLYTAYRNEKLEFLLWAVESYIHDIITKIIKDEKGK
jgi:hypothetical protein